MLDQSYYEKAAEIIDHYGRKASSLIPIMQEIQEEYRYLPGELQMKSWLRGSVARKPGYQAHIRA